MSAGPDLADWLRWVGLGCELTGLGITAAGIADLRRRYSDRPGIVAVTRASAVRGWVWLLAVAIACGRAVVDVGRWLRRTTRDRWRDLVNSVRRLQGRPQVRYGRSHAAFGGSATAVGKAFDATVAITPPASVEGRFAALEQQTRGLERSLVQLEDDVDRRIRDLASGGLRAEAVGVALLATGLILSSVSAGVADVIRRMLNL